MVSLWGNARNSYKRRHPELTSIQYKSNIAKARTETLPTCRRCCWREALHRGYISSLLSWCSHPPLVRAGVLNTWWSWFIKINWLEWEQMQNQHQIYLHRSILYTLNVTTCRTICSTNIPFPVKSLRCANATFPTHRNSCKQRQDFPILLTGWVIWAKIDILLSLKLMPRLDTEYSALQKTNCNFNHVCVNFIVFSGY